MGEVPVGATQQVNIRVDERTRDTLEGLAAASDRSLTRVVRYAIESWAGDEDREYPVTGRALAVTIPMRLDAVLVARVDAICEEVGVTRSIGIRAAIASWLSAAPAESLRTALGGPAVTGGL